MTSPSRTLGVSRRESRESWVWTGRMSFALPRRTRAAFTWSAYRRQISGQGLKHEVLQAADWMWDTQSARDTELIVSVPGTHQTMDAQIVAEKQMSSSPKRAPKKRQAPDAWFAKEPQTERMSSRTYGSRKNLQRWQQPRSWWQQPRGRDPSCYDGERCREELLSAPSR